MNAPWIDTVANALSGRRRALHAAVQEATPTETSVDDPPELLSVHTFQAGGSPFGGACPASRH